MAKEFSRLAVSGFPRLEATRNVDHGKLMCQMPTTLVEEQSLDAKWFDQVGCDTVCDIRNCCGVGVFCLGDGFKRQGQFVPP